YHTSYDDLDHLALGSLQHHGDNALATVSALADTDLSQPHQGKAVFFDLLAYTVVWWPVGRGVLLAGLALLLVLVAVGRHIGAGRFKAGSLAAGFFAVPIVLVVTALLAAAAGWLLRLLGPGLRVPFPAHTLPAVGTFWLLALLVTALVGGRLRRLPFSAVWSGVWLFWAIAGFAAALWMPGPSYLFLVPALFAGVFALVLPAGRAAGALTAVVPAVVAGLVWCPILLLFYVGLGTPGLLVLAGLVGVFLTVLVPLFAQAGSGWRKGVPVLTGLLILLGAVGIVVLPIYSTDSPRRMSFAYHLDGDTHEARFLAQTPGGLPPAVRQAAPFGKDAKPAFPFSNLTSFSAPAPALPLAAPQLTLVGETAEGGKRHVKLRLISPRGAYGILVAIPQAAAPESVTVAGHAVPPFGGQHGSRFVAGYQLLNLPAAAPEGVDLDIVLGGSGHEEWLVIDRSYGLPPTGAGLLAARPKVAAPIQEGDLTEVSHKVRI
ncbi:MAG TPA: hypothetical protein VMM92_04085, partial [Thermoanaerobaculia bacterium]|nr:hypothetical protein [Thermoanaerobaculia bacterium]